MSRLVNVNLMGIGLALLFAISASQLGYSAPCSSIAGPYSCSEWGLPGQDDPYPGYCCLKNAHANSPIGPPTGVEPNLIANGATQCGNVFAWGVNPLTLREECYLLVSSNTCGGALISTFCD
jgi:hypothetical protein